MLKPYWVFNMSTGHGRVLLASTPQKALLKACKRQSGAKVMAGRETASCGNWGVFTDRAKNEMAVRKYKPSR